MRRIIFTICFTFITAISLAQQNISDLLTIICEAFEVYATKGIPAS